MSFRHHQSDSRGAGPLLVPSAGARRTSTPSRAARQGLTSPQSRGGTKAPHAGHTPITATPHRLSSSSHNGSASLYGGGGGGGTSDGLLFPPSSAPNTAGGSQQQRGGGLHSSSQSYQRGQATSGPFPHHHSEGGATAAAAASANEDVECLTAVSKALGVILDDSIALSREAEAEAIELLDLAVEVFRSVTATASSSAEEKGGGGGRGEAGGATNNPAVAGGVASPFDVSPRRSSHYAAERARQRIGVLAHHCGILQTIGRLFPLRLTAGTRMRVAALRAFLSILQTCAAAEAEADAHSSASLIFTAVSEAFYPSAYEELGRGHGQGGFAAHLHHGGLSDVGVPLPTADSDICHSLLLLACDSSGASSDAARALAAEVLVFASGAWPSLLNKSLLPTLSLPCHHTAMAAATGQQQRQQQQHNSVGLGGGFGAGALHSHGRDAPPPTVPPSLAAAILVNAVEPDGVISLHLRVQLCALVRLVAQHAPRLFLGDAATGPVALFGGGDGSHRRPTDFAGARRAAVEVFSPTKGGNSSSSSPPRPFAPVTAVQLVVAFLDPRLPLHAPLVGALGSAMAYVGTLGGDASGNSPASAAAAAGVASAVAAVNNAATAAPFSLAPTEQAALRHGGRCCVLLVDALTDLLSASGATIAAQDTSAYWLEIVAVPAMADAFVRFLDWAMQITTRHPRDLPPHPAPYFPPSSSSSLPGGEGGEEGSGAFVGNIEKTLDPLSAVAAALAPAEEPLLFAAAVSLAKTALLLEGQYVARPLPPTAAERGSSSSPPRGGASSFLFDGATRRPGDGGGPPLITYRLLVGLDPSFSATLTYSGHTLPNARVWESYFVRAADAQYFPPSWHTAAHSAATNHSQNVAGANKNNITNNTASFSASTLDPNNSRSNSAWAGGGGSAAVAAAAAVADPTRAHRGLERLRLIRFAIAHAFAAPSMHLIELVMGGSGFQNASQAVGLSQQRLRGGAAVETARAVLRSGIVSIGGGGPSEEALAASASAMGGVDQSTATPRRGAAPQLLSAAAHDALVRSAAATMDKCGEALLVEASLLIAFAFAKSPTLRATASRFAVGYDAWAAQLASAVEAVVSHPRVAAAVLRHTVLVDVAQCILSDGEQAARVDRFDAKRIAAAMVREQEKRRLIAEAEAEESDGARSNGEGGGSGGFEPFSSQAEHDARCGRFSADCGSRFHFRGLGRAGSGNGAAKSGSSSHLLSSPPQRSIPTSPHRRRPPPPPTSVAIQTFDLDLSTIHFLLTQHDAADPSRVYTPRIATLCAELVKEVLIAATTHALIEGPRQLRAAALSAAEPAGRQGGQEGLAHQRSGDAYYQQQYEKEGGGGGAAAMGDGVASESTAAAHRRCSLLEGGDGQQQRRRATTPVRGGGRAADASSASASLGDRPMRTNYDAWLAQRTRARTPTNGGGGGAPSITKTIVAALTPRGGAAARGGKEPFRPATTAPKRALTPTIGRMAPPTAANASATHTAALSSSTAVSAAAAAAGVGGAPTVEQLIAASGGAIGAGGGGNTSSEEYLSIAIMMHLPITYGPHYERAQRAAVRHIKAPSGQRYVQPVLRATGHSWSARDVFVGEVYVLFLPFHRLSAARLAEEATAVQRHMHDARRMLVTTPTTQRSRRWFLSDMLNYVLPRTELLLGALKGFVERYSVADVVHQLTVVRLADEGHLRGEPVFEAAVEGADAAMPREVLRLSSGRFKDVIHSGNLVFVIAQLRDLYAKKERAAAMGGDSGAGVDGEPFFAAAAVGGSAAPPTRLREIEREIENIRRIEEASAYRGGYGGAAHGTSTDDMFAGMVGLPPAGATAAASADADDGGGAEHSAAAAAAAGGGGFGGAGGGFSLGGFGGMPMSIDEFGGEDEAEEGDDAEEAFVGSHFGADEFAGSGGRSATAPTLLPSSAAQPGSAAFIAGHKSLALNGDGGRGYTDPYSATDLRRFVSDAYEDA